LNCKQACDLFFLSKRSYVKKITLTTIEIYEIEDDLFT
jgi:hypothetical protein